MYSKYVSSYTVVCDTILPKTNMRAYVVIELMQPSVVIENQVVIT